MGIKNSFISRLANTDDIDGPIYGLSAHHLFLVTKIICSFINWFLIVSFQGRKW